MNTKAIIYCRVACGQGLLEENTSIQYQRAECLKYAQEHNNEVVDTVIECGSGLKINSELRIIHRRIEMEEVQVIIMLSSDRISRDFVTCRKFIKNVEDYGGRIELVNLDVPFTNVTNFKHQV